eukprot:IDg14412t1
MLEVYCYAVGFNYPTSALSMSGGSSELLRGQWMSSLFTTCISVSETVPIRLATGSEVARVRVDLLCRDLVVDGEETAAGVCAFRCGAGAGTMRSSPIVSRFDPIYTTAALLRSCF